MVLNLKIAVIKERYNDMKENVVIANDKGKVKLHGIIGSSHNQKYFLKPFYFMA